MDSFAKSTKGCCVPDIIRGVGIHCLPNGQNPCAFRTYILVRRDKINEKNISIYNYLSDCPSVEKNKVGKRNREWGRGSHLQRRWSGKVPTWRGHLLRKLAGGMAMNYGRNERVLQVGCSQPV